MNDEMNGIDDESFLPSGLGPDDDHPVDDHHQVISQCMTSDERFMSVGIVFPRIRQPAMRTASPGQGGDHRHRPVICSMLSRQ